MCPIRKSRKLCTTAIPSPTRSIYKGLKYFLKSYHVGYLYFCIFQCPFHQFVHLVFCQFLCSLFRRLVVQVLNPQSFFLQVLIFILNLINYLMTVSTLDILSFKYILGTLGLLADDLGCFVWFEDGDRIAPALKFGCSLDDGFDATCFGTECFFNGFSPDLELAPSLDPAWF